MRTRAGPLDVETAFKRLAGTDASSNEKLRLWPMPPERDSLISRMPSIDWSRGCARPVRVRPLHDPASRCRGFIFPTKRDAL
jgi:hypothetical protein